MNFDEPFAIQLDYINEICAAVLAQENSSTRDVQMVRSREQPVLSVAEMYRYDQDAAPSPEKGY